jgi:cell division protein ZapE
MDCFFAAINVKRKQRVHFHEFMRSIHRQLEEVKGHENPLDIVAANVAKATRLLCFDEFHISDIADAMILERLLRGLFERGVCLVTTSNYEPDRLYPDGLHRDRILPAIELLKENLAVIQVDAGQDYRRRVLTQAGVYFSDTSEASQQAIKRVFDSVAEATDTAPALLIENRTIQALRRAGGVVWFDFATLCGGPRSQNDYLELAIRFHTVVLTGVPLMGAAMSSEARRFTWLVDVFYDQKVKLVIQAAGAPEQLYTTGLLAHEFQRTVSRLLEMQSEEYLGQARLKH